MEIEYGNNKLRKQLSNATEIKKAFGTMAKSIAARLDDIKAAPNLKVLGQLPQAACHPLTGNRNGQWSVTISGNHRLIFEILNNPVPISADGGIDTIKVTGIIIVEKTDYH